jgi:hypothetical protein
VDSKLIHEQLHDNLDPSSEFSQDSDIDIFDCTDPDPEIRRADLSDSCSNSDDDQASVNVGGDDGGGGGNKDNDNEDLALWDENDHDFYMTTFCAAPGYKPPQNRQMPISLPVFFMLFFVQLCLNK